MKNKLRQITRSLYLDIMGFIANPAPGIHIMNSHLLSIDKDLDANVFDKQLALLSKKSSLVSFEEAVSLIKNKKSVNKSLIAFTYDDGFEECCTHLAPVLEKYNAYAGFFIVPNFINGDEAYIKAFLKNKVHLPDYKKPMSWEQIAELSKKGHTIGAHTMDHENIAKIDTESELYYQIGNCKNEIEKQIGTNCDYFAFPYGGVRHITEDSVKLAQKYYKYIFSASNWQKYFSYNEDVLNRRHCEPYWPINHINYFLSKKIEY